MEFGDSGIIQICFWNAIHNLRYVRDGLHHINDGLGHQSDFNNWYPKWIADGIRIFGNKKSRDFFFYWADKDKDGATGGGCRSSAGPLTRRVVRRLNRTRKPKRCITGLRLRSTSGEFHSKSMPMSRTP